MLDMTLQTHLVKRGNQYYFRAKVPVDLRDAFGKAEVKYTLKTKDPKKAKHLVRLASAEFENQCAAFRAQHTNATPQSLVLNDTLIQGLCDLWQHHALAGDEYSRRQGLTEDEFDDQSTAREETQTHLKKLLARGQLDRIDPALQQFLFLLNLDVTGDADAWNRLRYQFLQTVTQTHSQQVQRDTGDVIRTPKPPVQSIVKMPTQNASLDELCEDWKRFDPTRPKKTVEDVERTLKELFKVVGNKAAEHISRADICEYRDQLIEKGLTPKTVSKKIAFIRAIYNVAIDKEKITRNPAQRISLPRSREKPRLPFTLDDLKQIFGSPLYTGHHELGRDVGAAGLWLPLLSLYQGCREEELAQLLATDVQQIDGIWYLFIVDEEDEAGQGKQLKNTRSRRLLPLHDVVIEAGFIHYVTAVQKENHVRLFPTLKPDKYGKYSAGFSKAFMKYLRNELGITDTGKVFHSFRHTFRDACREAGFDEELSDSLMGHSNKQKSGRGYGSSFTLKRLKQYINKIKYPGVRVPVLIPPDQDE